MDELFKEMFSSFTTNEELFEKSYSKYWGEGNIHVVFSLKAFKVVSRCKTRQDAARLLRRFRQAQREIRKTWRVGANGIMRPPAHVQEFKPYSLRWIANKLPIICVRGADVGGKRKSAFTCLCPLWRHYQSLKA